MLKDPSITYSIHSLHRDITLDFKQVNNYYKNKFTEPIYIF